MFTLNSGLQDVLILLPQIGACQESIDYLSLQGNISCRHSLGLLFRDIENHREIRNWMIWLVDAHSDQFSVDFLEWCLTIINVSVEKPNGVTRRAFRKVANRLPARSHGTLYTLMVDNRG